MQKGLICNHRHWSERGRKWHENTTYLITWHVCLACGLWRKTRTTNSLIPDDTQYEVFDCECGRNCIPYECKYRLEDDASE